MDGLFFCLHCSDVLGGGRSFSGLHTQPKLKFNHCRMKAALYPQPLEPLYCSSLLIVPQVKETTGGEFRVYRASIRLP